MHSRGLSAIISFDLELCKLDLRILHFTIEQSVRRLMVTLSEIIMSNTYFYSIY